MAKRVMNSNLFPIAKEGWKYLIFSATFFIFFYLFSFTILSFLSFLSIIAFIFTFRNPERELALFSNASVVSPCDGIVKSITELNDDLYSYKLEIESSCFDVGILRVPMKSKIGSILKQHGSRVSNKSKLFNDINENVELIFIDENLNKLKIIHRLKNSYAPLYINNIVKEQTVQQTQRYGFMVNGLTTIYLPSNFRLDVNVSSEVKASQTLIGYFS